MAEKKLNLLDFLVFLVTPEDSTERYPDPVFGGSDPALVYLPGYQQVMKTVFWVLVSVAFSVMISQLR